MHAYLTLTCFFIVLKVHCYLIYQWMARRSDIAFTNGSAEGSYEQDPFVRWQHYHCQKLWWWRLLNVRFFISLYFIYLFFFDQLVDTAMFFQVSYTQSSYTCCSFLSLANSFSFSASIMEFRFAFFFFSCEFCFNNIFSLVDFTILSSLSTSSCLNAVFELFSLIFPTYSIAFSASCVVTSHGLECFRSLLRFFFFCKESQKPSKMLGTTFSRNLTTAKDVRSKSSVLKCLEQRRDEV